ncbi:HAD family hydrolase [Hamadaea tsunoensis]|uniref:HAD family hydrolase n=1 Tax=Hamadaea tsunoensis TaxID=53368 RepID=UPI000404B712|nr:HAD family phosphatase [Hamadaea tsunoensis]
MEPDLMADVDAFLLDMDGTLVDTERYWLIAIQKVATALGAPPIDEDLLAGGSVETIMAVVLAAIPGGADYAEVKDLIGAAVEKEIAVAGIQLRPGARRLLDAVARTGLPCALVTSSDREKTEPALDVLGRSYFRVTVTADDVVRHKPDPLPYATAARLLGVAPERCLAVEDSLAGVHAAEAAGCRTIAVPQVQKIPAVPGRVILDSLDPIAEAIEKHRA